MTGSGQASKGSPVTPTIICAIEQGTAEPVARACGELARDLEARVVLTHVREDPPLFNSTMDRERARNRSTRRGEAVLRPACDALPAGVDSDVRVELGVAVTQLADLAEEFDAALIVVGGRGRGRLAAALLGSVSQALARQALFPVMIIPDNASTTDAGRLADAQHEGSTIIAAVDGSKEASDTVRFARDLADRLGDRLVIRRRVARGPYRRT